MNFCLFHLYECYVCLAALQACASAADLVAVEGAVHAAMAAWPSPCGSSNEAANVLTGTAAIPSSTSSSNSAAGGLLKKGGAAEGQLGCASMGHMAAAAAAAAAAGESWGAVCERVLGVPPSTLWRSVLQPAFGGRAKEVRV